jgi:hypothetical protein
LHDSLPKGSLVRTESSTGKTLTADCAAQVWLTGGTIELPSFEFLGEDPKGEWTALVPALDLSMRAILLSLLLDVFAINRATQGQPVQSDGTNRSKPLDDRGVKFREPVVAMAVGESASTTIAVPGGRQRLPVEHSLGDSDNGTKLNMDSVLSVFKNGRELSIVIESLQSHECRFTASTRRIDIGRPPSQFDDRTAEDRR